MKQQVPITVYYDGLVVGDCLAGLLVGDAIIVELKAAKGCPDSTDALAAQCLNFLKATGLPLCLLLSFSNTLCRD